MQQTDELEIWVNTWWRHLQAAKKLPDCFEKECRCRAAAVAKAEIEMYLAQV
jgi:hypothetical protein